MLVTLDLATILAVLLFLLVGSRLPDLARKLGGK